MARFGLPYVMLLLLTGCGPQNNPQLAPVLGANVLKPDEKSKKTVTVELPGVAPLYRIHFRVPVPRALTVRSPDLARPRAWSSAFRCPPMRRS